MIARAADGFFHPATVDEVVELVKHAHDNHKRLRVVGAGMSMTRSIMDGWNGTDEPPPEFMALVLDKMRAVTIQAEGDHATAEVEAGCLIGSDYSDQTGASWETSLSHQLHEAGYALDALGGVSHQAIGGCLGTATGGGSVKYALLDNLVRFQLVDGTGTLHDVRYDDPNPDKRELFYAAGTSMGLLGVMVKVWLRVGRTYNLIGSEDSRAFLDAPMDLTGQGRDGKVSLEQYFRDTDYSRMLWWPQHDLNRVQVWHCERQEPSDDFERIPFHILDTTSSLAGSFFLTLIGNLDDLGHAPLGRFFRQLDRALDGKTQDAAHHPDDAEPTPLFRKFLRFIGPRLKQAAEEHPDINEGIEADDDEIRAVRDDSGVDPDDGWDWNDWLVAGLQKALTWGLSGPLGPMASRVIKRLLPGGIDNLLHFFVPENHNKEFAEPWLYGLPMDNVMSEALWHTDFTELWIPLSKTQQVVDALKEFYEAGGDQAEAYKRTGPFAVELYPGRRNGFWLSPGYSPGYSDRDRNGSDGNGDGGEDFLRVNVFWFHKWKGTPADEFYPRIWELLEDIGFRTHFGKWLPGPSPEWVAYQHAQLPKLADFLAKRSELDPHDVFLTDYWRDHLIG